MSKIDEIAVLSTKKGYKMRKQNCLYYELFTEIESCPVQISDNPDEYYIDYAEVPIGEICHKKKTSEFDCENCKLYKKYERMEIENSDFPW